MKYEDMASASALGRPPVEDTLQSLGVGVYALGPDWKCVDVNRLAELHFMHSREQLLGASVWEVFPGLEATPIGEGLKRCMSERSDVIVEAPSRARPGRFVEIRMTPLNDGGIACAFVDITARAAAERALEESKSFLWLVLNSARIGFYAIDLSGTITMANSAFCEMLGINSEDAVGKRLHQVAPHARADGSLYAPEEFPILRCAAAGLSHHVSEEFFHKRDGSPVPVEYWAEPIMRDGAPAGAICTFADITERKIAEEKERRFARELEEQVAARTAERDRMWQLSTDMMIVGRTDGTILAANPAVEAVLGWPRHELLGTSGLDLIHPDDLQETLAQVSRLDRGEKIFSYECRQLCKDGSYRVVSYTAVPSGGLVYAVGRDVTAQREAQEALRNAGEALRQAQKMEAIGRLTGGVAHDFNNVLQVIGGSLQLLSRDVAGNARAEQRLQTALAGVSRGSRLASQLLAFGRRQPLAPKVINLGRLVRGFDDMLRRALGEEIEIETIIAGGLWNTFVDLTQVENALLNLAINARDAMEGRGKLTIEAGNAFLDDEYAARHAEVVPGQYVMLAVTDTGAGISPDILDRVFDPFFTTKKEGQGTGLGLSMVYGFVKQSGGHVKIYSEAGHGTTVRLYLPRTREAEDVETDVDTGPASGGTETVLVVEDDEDVRATVVEMLSELGYRVLRAKDAEAGLAIIESGVPIDLLFTDVVMPGAIRSTELARKARERLPNIAVLFTSGYTENAIVHGGRLDEGVELLSKPYSREALARKLRHCLGSRAQQSSLGCRSRTGSKGLRVLVVEDEMLIRLSTCEMLKELGYEVSEAANATDALAALNDDTPDILLTDLGLPGMSGDQLAALALERVPTLRFVFATGYDMRVEGLPPRVSQRARVLRKPFDTGALKMALDHCDA